jgi:hypothetical protein
MQIIQCDHRIPQPGNLLDFSTGFMLSSEGTMSWHLRLTAYCLL